MKVLLAISTYITRVGLKHILLDESKDTIIKEADSSGVLISQIIGYNPDLVFINYLSPLFSLEDISTLRNTLPNVKIIAITDFANADKIKMSMSFGVNGHLLDDCGPDEIIEAVETTMDGGKFYCGKILDALDGTKKSNRMCDGVGLSKREIEIIQQIADGKTNKEVAETLCLSTHTVMTHRKNIMQKLGINNTAGIVIYAVKENLISPK